VVHIFHKRDSILLINKPVGIPVFPKSGTLEDSLLSRLLALEPQRSEQDWPAGFDGGIVHRLDTPTTGGVLVACNDEHVRRVRTLFSQKRLSKRYLFLSAKEPNWIEHFCAAPLAHDRKKKGNMIPKRGKNTPHRGKWYESRTSFRHIIRKDGLSLWEAKMRTGVMHQIRVHAAFLGIALLGDRRYGGGKKPSGFLGDFALHHTQIGDWPAIPPPEWWPSWVQKHQERFL
jgi:23S rRNA-/tRNA-specific pseudouridylate synthase